MQRTDSSSHRDPFRTLSARSHSAVGLCWRRDGPSLTAERLKDRWEILQEVVSQQAILRFEEFGVVHRVKDGLGAQFGARDGEPHHGGKEVEHALAAVLATRDPEVPDPLVGQPLRSAEFLLDLCDQKANVLAGVGRSDIKDELADRGLVALLSASGSALAFRFRVTGSAGSLPSRIVFASPSKFAN